MASYNKVILVGNMTRDIEMRNTNSGTQVGQFAVAVNRKFGDKDETVFVDCTAWGKTAEVLSNYAGKGAAILCDGRLSQDNWTDKATGQKRSKLYVTVETVQLLEKRGESSHSAPQYGERDSNRYAPQPAPFPGSAPPAQPNPFESTDDSITDIPF